jgi:predicted Ser/Thr protein kinase
VNVHLQLRPFGLQENAEQNRSPTPPPLPDTTADTDDKHAHHTHHHHHPLLKLKEQLSKKSRHPSAIPGSFYERASAFTPHPHVLHIVSPRTTGHVQFRRGKLASWTSALCALSGADLILYPAPVSSTSSTSDHADGESSSGSPAAAAAAEAPSPATPPLAKVHLVGAHLRSGVDRYPTEMSVEEADGVVIALRAPTAEQRDEWLVALGHVSGLFRRVGDYYVLGKSWGHGATSEVQEAVGRFTGRRTAVKKRIKTTREATEAMHNELRILQICAKSPHPAIPSLEDYFFDTDGRIELVMELMDGGELFDWIAEREMLHEMQAKGVFEQVASGVAHLHSLGIAHRDLKPQVGIFTLRRIPK